MRATLGMRLTAAAVTLVGTMGVATAAVMPQQSVEEPVYVASDGFDATTVVTLDDSYYAPSTTTSTPAQDGEDAAGEPSTTTTTDGSTSTPEAPAAPSTTVAPAPLVPPLPVPALPAAAQPVAAAVNDVLALLPTPDDLQAAVLDCVSDLRGIGTAAVGPSGPVTGLLNGLLGDLGRIVGLGGVLDLGGLVQGAPALGGLQAAIDGCLSGVVGLLPDPAGLAQALTAVVNGAVPAPVVGLLAQLTGGLPSSTSPSDLLTLVSGLLGATGGPGGLVDQLVGVLDPLVPSSVADLVGYPFAVVEQLFASLGIA